MVSSICSSFLWLASGNNDTRFGGGSLFTIPPKEEPRNLGTINKGAGNKKSAVPQKKNGTKTWDYFVWHDWDGLGVWVRLLSVWETASKIAVSVK